MKPWKEQLRENTMAADEKIKTRCNEIGHIYLRRTSCRARENSVRKKDLLNCSVNVSRSKNTLTDNSPKLQEVISTGISTLSPGMNGLEAQQSMMMPPTSCTPLNYGPPAKGFVFNGSEAQQSMMMPPPSCTPSNYGPPVKVDVVFLLEPLRYASSLEV